MSPIIQRIESVGSDARARRICFDDESTPRVTSIAAIKLLGLKVGDTVAHDDVLSGLAAHEPQLTRDRALQLLGYRERSSAELRQRLIDNGYPAAIVDEVVARFCEVELVDDRRFASLFVRSRVNAGYGRLRIRRELSRRGVSDEIVDSALAEHGLQDDELSRARDALRGRRPRDSRDRDRLVRQLVTRGYELQTAIQAVADVSEREPDSSS